MALDFSYFFDRYWWECEDCGGIYATEEEANMCWNATMWPEDVTWAFNHRFIDVSAFWGRLDG
jgi:hypothetical protein